MSLPTEMTAIAIREPGGPEVLVTERIPLPEPGPGQLLVRVACAGVNRPDVVQRLGHYPAPPGAPKTPGLEIAGEVVQCGPDTRRWRIGDQVCALVSGGGYAEFCVADESAALPVPAGLPMTQAAALPETIFTVWHNVFERGRLQAGETLLVHGGSSGIGTIAIMLGKAFGAKVLATAGTADKCAACLKLGADRAINYRSEDFVEVIREETKDGADVILDMVGGDYVQRNIKAAAADGRIVQIAFLKGARVEVDLMRLMLKRLTLTGSTLRARSTAFKADLAAAVEREVLPKVAAGQVAPVIDSTFALEDAAKAHARMESSEHIGKIMLEVS